MPHPVVRPVLAAFLLLASVSATWAESALRAEPQPLRIDRVTPDGDNVQPGQQIVLQFNRAVVPVGRMERDAKEIPIAITPPLACEWHWLNTSALACNLPEAAPMRSATHYRITVNLGIRAEDGATIPQADQHDFTTELPRIRRSSFAEWHGPETPLLRITFSQPVTRDEAQKHLRIIGRNGSAPAMGVRVESETANRHSEEEEDAHPAKSTPQDPNAARDVWIVSPVSKLNPDGLYQLDLLPGLHSTLGPEAGLGEPAAYSFDTLPTFTFLGVECPDFDGHTIKIAPDATLPDKGCDPMSSTKLLFSAPVRHEMVSALTFTPPVRFGGDDSENGTDESETVYQPHHQGRTYETWLPSGLKAGQSYRMQSRSETMHWYERAWLWVKSLFVAVPPLDIRDAFGRRLEGTAHAQWKNDHRRPNYVMDYRHAVLESGIDSEIPFYVNNIDHYDFAYRMVTAAGAKANQSFRSTPPKVPDIQFAVPFGMRQMLGGKSGAVYGHLTSTPRIRSESKEGAPLFAQVTPFQLHLKLGHYSSLLWATDFATGQPVSGLALNLYRGRYTELGVPSASIAKAVTDAHGLAALPGTSEIDPDLLLANSYDNGATRLFVRAEKNGEMGILPVDYEYQPSYTSGEDSIWASTERRYGHMRSWGTTAQGIYRAGDTIEYKIFVRDEDNRRLTPPPKDAHYTLEIHDPTGKSVHKVGNIALSEFGGYAGQFTTAKEGAVGWHEFRLSMTAPGLDENGRKTTFTQSFNPMRVLVSDFTVSPFKVKTQLNGDHFHADDSVEVTTHAELHSGGAYTDATARVTAILDAMHFQSQNPIARAFSFDSFSGENSSEQIFQTTEKVDARGELVTRFTPARPGVVYGHLTVESAVQDERGKFITGSTRADYVGVDRLVGMHTTRWLYEAGKAAPLQTIVVDKKGEPVAGTKVDTIVEREETKAARVKGAGSAYLTEYHTEWVKAGECHAESTAAASDCNMTPDKAGYYRATASIKDTHGVAHSSKTYFYATGGDAVVWEDNQGSGLDLVPESRSYKVGDKARFLVKNPYPGTQALISVERYGVMDSWVQTLQGSTPVIEVPILPDYVPGAYLSVTIVSPRVEKPLVPVGQVDLGKPAMRMGYAKLTVSDPYKDIAVTAKTDRALYKPGEEVTVDIQTDIPHPEEGNPPVELTVVALDEAVLDLVAGGEKYYDPKDGLRRLDSLDLKNYSLLTRLIGRQKFEKKGANPGGDGGSDLAMRSVFKFVSYWNPNLRTDSRGHAQIKFTNPDNLTGWRIFAIATTPGDRFGLGQTSFKVNRPTEIRPVMPNQLSEGDTFQAGFSVMNRTDTERTLAVTIDAEGTLKEPGHLAQSITIAPYKRAVLKLPLAVANLPLTRDVPGGEIRFKATAKDETDGDGMTHSLPVKKRRTLAFAATYGSTTEDTAHESLLVPADAMPDSGKVSLHLAPSVIGNLEGAFRYMAEYPYWCWEQRLTKGVMADTYRQLRDYLPADMTPWKEAATLPQQALDDAANFQAPNGGMAYFVASDEHSDPYLSAYTALAFHWLRATNHQVPATVEDKLQAYLVRLLKNDATPERYSEGMRATVRAVALAALAQEGKVTAEDIARYQPHLKEMSLIGKAMFLQAANAVEDSKDAREEAAKAILAMSNQTGGKFIFSETLDDGYDHILASPLRENCAVLSAFAQLAKRPEGRALTSDVPEKLVRTITQTRGSRTHWQNTQENVYCTQALADYARIYESETPNMRVTATLGEIPMGEAKFTAKRDPEAVLQTPVTPALLGKKEVVEINRSGAGRLYYNLQLSYALPLGREDVTNAGIEIKRESRVQRAGKWEALPSGAPIQRGELVRTDLYLALPAARNFVVVDEPVPGGMEPVNTQLANASKVDAGDNDSDRAGGALWLERTDWIDFGAQFWSFYHQEIKHDAVRFYSDYLPAGHYHLSYTAQAIASGSFASPPALAQEMYNPDVYGRSQGATLVVEEPKTEEPKPAP